ncbi:MAG: glutaredoxin family protein [Deltaproteobacteria bacterium]|nr:MAG: glutaredoxin family protein [Deltaproteobacteria bacterium]
MHALTGRLARLTGRLALAIWLALAPLPGTAAGAPEQALVVYVRDGCPHCAAAKAFLADLSGKRPDLHIVYRPIDRDPAAREALLELFRRENLGPPGVPVFVWEGKPLVGFHSAETTGRDLLDLIGPAEPPPPKDRVESALFGTLSASQLGLPLFTLALGLLDGFNPCATWVLLFLLALLVRLQDRRRMALVAGTFVLASGAVYYAFMAAWLNVFLLVGMSTALRLGLGGVALVIGGINVKDFFAFGAGPSLSIPAAAKPGLYARVRRVLNAEALPASLAAVTLLAVVVNFIELLCTAGFPAIYTAVLTQQQLSPAAYYGYLGLYIAGYIADDALMVAVAVVALASHKLTERAGRWLKLLSGLVMLALGVVMMVRPEWLR